MLRDRDSDPSKAGLSEYLPWVDLLSMSSEPLLAAAGKWTVGSSFLPQASVNTESAGDTQLSRGEPRPVSRHPAQVRRANDMARKTRSPSRFIFVKEKGAVAVHF